MRPTSIVKYEGIQNPLYKRRIDPATVDLSKPSDEKLNELTAKTKAALGQSIQSKTEAAYVGNIALKQKSDTHYVKYTPKQTGLGHNSGAEQRVIKMSSSTRDPLEPARFKHKRIPAGGVEEPAPIMQSPPRKLTVKDQLDWKIPPCVSNWKNAKGYTIPLHMRLQADGRNLQDTTVNERFAGFVDSLYTAERQARTEIEERNKIQESMDMMLAMRKEQELRDEANLARAEKAGLIASSMSQLGSERKREAPSVDILGKKRSAVDRDLEEAKKDRDAIRYQRKREIIRDRRIEAAGNRKAKLTRDTERDISEKIALGQAQPTSKEGLYDQRLFNQTSGLDSGFTHEEDYNLYDKPLFADRTAASIYKGIKEVPVDDEDDNVGNLLRKGEKGSEGADKQGKAARSKPVEFEKISDSDLFGLNEAMDSTRKRQKTDK